MRRVFTSLAVIFLYGCATVPIPPAALEGSALILDGGTTLGAATTQSVLIHNGRIVATGSPIEMARRASSARHIDLGGAVILPGLVDAHGHLPGLGRFFDNASLVGTTSIKDIQNRLLEHSAKLAADEWLLGRGWDQNDWDVKAFPTAADLDAVISDRPVWIDRIDGHAAWANTKAMELAGITAGTRDPDGGKIIRDEAGNPTGIFIDNAATLIDAKVPPPTRERRKARLLAAMRDAAKQGLTAVHDAGMDDVDVSILRESADGGEMPIRVYVMLTDDATLLEKWFAQGPLLNYRDLLTVRAVKMYADGALGSRGAALLAPYSDAASNSGLMLTTPEHIVDVALRAKKSGFQVNIHAIGDRAVRVAIDSYEKAGIGPAERFRIEHFQIAHPDDIRRAARLGIIASMQPTHATSDMYWAEQRVGPERIRGAYAWRSVLSNGGRLAFGSDFPVEQVNPFLGIHAAVTRQDQKRWPEGGWMPQERLTLSEAVAGFTTGAAYAAFEEATRGSIEAGKAADLTIVASLDLQRLDETKVLYTIVNGKIVYGE
jgi:predicted amidohydrolase YtcJ